MEQFGKQQIDCNNIEHARMLFYHMRPLLRSRLDICKPNPLTNEGIMLRS